MCYWYTLISNYLFYKKKKKTFVIKCRTKIGYYKLLQLHVVKWASMSHKKQNKFGAKTQKVAVTYCNPAHRVHPSTLGSRYTWGAHWCRNDPHTWTCLLDSGWGTSPAPHHHPPYSLHPHHTASRGGCRGTLPGRRTHLHDKCCWDNPRMKRKLYEWWA